MKSCALFVVGVFLGVLLLIVLLNIGLGGVEDVIPALDSVLAPSVEAAAA